MRNAILSLLLTVASLHHLHAQSRIYALAGICGVTGDYIYYKGQFGTASFEIDFERKIVGSVYGIYGLNYFQTQLHSDGFFSSTSNLKNTYLGLPILLRLNFQNRNSAYMDFGFVPTYLVRSHLSETLESTGVSDEGFVQAYVPRLGVSIRFAMTMAVNRFLFTFLSDYPLSQKPGTGTLTEWWSLSLDDSTFLTQDGFTGFLFVGFRMGYRLR